MHKILRGFLILRLVIINIFFYRLRRSGKTYKMIERKNGISIKTQKRRFKQLFKSQHESVNI
ncbi:MAG: hypothetical protein PWR19_661 [Carnobacterium sp.]|nr:hypothetical protein [Carnobacterium sp.]